MFPQARGLCAFTDYTDPSDQKAPQWETRGQQGMYKTVHVDIKGNGGRNSALSAEGKIK